MTLGRVGDPDQIRYRRATILHYISRRAPPNKSFLSSMDGLDAMKPVSNINMPPAESVGNCCRRMTRLYLL